MKVDCNIAHDLMPLVLDGIASAESQKLVEEHLAECGGCREYLDGMKAALTHTMGESNQQEQKAFEEATQKVRKKRRRRLLRNTAIGLLVGLVVAVGCVWAWVPMTQAYTVQVYHGQYQVFLSRLADGSVAFNMDWFGNRQMAVSIEDQVENGEKILYVYCKRPMIPTGAYVVDNYSFLRMKPDELREYAEIREGFPDEYAVIWARGDSVAAASDEMEQYFALRDELEPLVFVQTEDGRQRTLTYEEQQQDNELSRQMEEVKRTVPEWK